MGQKIPDGKIEIGQNKLNPKFIYYECLFRIAPSSHTNEVLVVFKPFICSKF